MKYIFSDKKTREKRKAGLAKNPCFALNIRNRLYSVLLLRKNLLLCLVRPDIPDELNYGYGGIITCAITHLYYPRITACAVTIPQRKFVKKFPYNFPVSHIGKGLSPCMKTAFLPKGNHFFSNFPQFFGFGISRRNLLVFQKRCYHVSQH